MTASEQKKIVVKKGKNVAAAPKASVVIPVYNVAAYIAETLDSVLAQTFENYEIILVNDGSTDAEKLNSALAPYFDRLVYVEQENAGASQARNSAINSARGELIAFLDGDDVWLPDFLRSQIDFLEKNDLEMVYCDALIFGETISSRQTFSQTAPSNGAVTPVSLINAECNVITSGTIVRRDSFEKFGLFDVAMRRGQDFEMWFRLAKRSIRIGYQREILLKYRVRADGLTGTSLDRAERNISVMNAVREKHDLNAGEQAAWDARMIAYEAECDLEKGKLCLASGDLAGAKTHLFAANEFYHNRKLALLNRFLRIAPRLTARIFKTLRPAEFSHIASHQ